jgi:hypothetical protein
VGERRIGSPACLLGSHYGAYGDGSELGEALGAKPRSGSAVPLPDHRLGTEATDDPVSAVGLWGLSLLGIPPWCKPLERAAPILDVGRLGLATVSGTAYGPLALLL